MWWFVLALHQNGALTTTIGCVCLSLKGGFSVGFSWEVGRAGLKGVDVSTSGSRRIYVVVVDGRERSPVLVAYWVLVLVRASSRSASLM